jgi:hypothetical protein
MKRGRPFKEPRAMEALQADAKLRERIQWFMEHQIWTVKEETPFDGGPVQMTAEMVVKGEACALRVFSLPCGIDRATTRLHLDLFMAQHLATQT